ncbi:hypothetical protein LV84_03538 [Algoriphagus ratkowskyi]|uniref:Lipoprotein n=1 Tax=Algoriphagus ratkowskyi TaxID=57028 RepID=A0A2W7RD69_9BACT|nr:hypothetical protein [Algoriphagus ratkowskyi]PZX52129.1 hypothetical protein LV84_03538 [Algoriphagus ratkowskyi]TXD76108.1 hypothetical protein ESW18_17725 [Algoriphagus ratkowskyi]
MRLFCLIFLIQLFLFSCESPGDKENRLKLEQQAIRESDAESKEAEEERKLALEIERKTQELYNRYINNSLNQGATPYSSCFGGNQICSSNGCSEIKVNGPKDSDVLVTIKSGNRVIRHAYIKSGNSYTFQLPNGKYQPFFYFGKGRNPEKEMGSQSCTELKGGFISEDVFGKDDPQELGDTVLTYSLVLQKSGNFSTRPSNELEAF